MKEYKYCLWCDKETIHDIDEQEEYTKVICSKCNSTVIEK